MPNASVLLVEDDFLLRRTLTAGLRDAGYEVTAVASAEEATEALSRCWPAVVLLDWMLPAQSGITLLRTWRAEGNRRPVILMSARDAVADRVVGLEAGASDFVCKPFAMPELLARIKVQLRDQVGVERQLQLESCEVDLTHQQVMRGDDICRLAAREATLLHCLVSHEGRTVGRDELAEEVWGERDSLTTRTIDNAVLRLRAKIEADPHIPRHIITVHGEGYRFES